MIQPGAHLLNILNDHLINLDNGEPVKVLDQCYFVVLLDGEAETTEGAQFSRAKLIFRSVSKCPANKKHCQRHNGPRV